MVDRQIDRRQETLTRILDAADLMSFKEILIGIAYPDEDMQAEMNDFISNLTDFDIEKIVKILDGLIVAAKGDPSVVEAATAFMVDQTRDVGGSNAWVEFTRTVDGVISTIMVIADIGNEDLMTNIDVSKLKNELKALREKYGIADDMSEVRFAN